MRTFLVAILLTLAAPLSAHAQSADLVLCDRVAADPSDPDKPAEVRGVTEIAASDVATAIKFCKQAALSSRRAMFALGRAYAANRQTAEAMAAWRKAADKGSSAAMVELGVAYGTGSGVARDEAQARKLFDVVLGHCAGVITGATGYDLNGFGATEYIHRTRAESGFQ
jgi:hypothetical protein